MFFKFIFMIIIVELISSSKECRATRTKVSNASIINFPPIGNITLPDGRSQKKITCQNQNCDANEIFESIECDGDFRTHNYECRLINEIVNYELKDGDYEVVCNEDFPTNENNCYLFINLTKTVFEWTFDSRIKISNPFSPNNLIDQVVCYGSDGFCKEKKYGVVKCSGVFARNDFTQYQCSVIDLSNSYELVQYSIMCPKMNVRTNEKCFIAIKVYEIKSTGLQPFDDPIKKLLYGTIGFLIATCLYGFVYFFFG